MDNSRLMSLRLGFSEAQADEIQKHGLKAFLKKSFEPQQPVGLPDFLQNSSKTLAERKVQVTAAIAQGEDSFTAYKKQQKQEFTDFKTWWTARIMNTEYPLREKMTVFWHNHFVASGLKVKLPYWLFTHNNLLREHAFGNFRELTKMIIKSNAVLFYLDNTNNRKGNINENLSRELMELFTLGFGNYSEADIKNGAKGLAGLTVSENGGAYKPKIQDDETITYFGKTGIFKADELVDIIFEQPKIPYLITRKILQWFITDIPDEKSVLYYGDYFRKKDFEIEPLLFKIFTEEASKPGAGTKIKDPLLYILQLTDLLNIKNIRPETIQVFAQRQGMGFYSQYNVKGWSGGRDWLSIQNYTQRNAIAGWLCSGKTIAGAKIMEGKLPMPDWNSNAGSLEIIADFKRKLLVANVPELQDDFEQILKDGFNSDPEMAADSVLKLFQFIAQMPEFQLI